MNIDKLKSVAASLLRRIHATGWIGVGVLFFAGISGAWIGNLTAFEPYQPVFVTIALACLGYGFYLVYRKPRAAECIEGSYCARPSSHRNAKMGLWIATILIIVAVGFPYAARFFLTA